MLITVCTLQTRVHFLTSYCHMLRSCTFGSNCKQQEVNTPIYWFFVVYLGLKFKKKKSVHICGTSPSCWGEICASAAQHECSLVCLYVVFIVQLTWFRGGSPQNQSDEQKTESAGGDISQNTDESAPLCVHKRSDSPPDKPVYCPPNFETSLHSLSALSFHSSVITT